MSENLSLASWLESSDDNPRRLLLRRSVERKPHLKRRTWMREAREGRAGVDEGGRKRREG